MGLCVNIKSLEGLVEDLLMPEDTCFKYLLTYKFSQDHLELFLMLFDKEFSVIQCTCSMFCVLCRATMFAVAGPMQKYMLLPGLVGGISISLVENCFAGKSTS